MLTFILRLLKHLALLFLVSIPLQLLGIILLAIYLPIHFQLIKCHLRKSIALPYLLRFFDNADPYVGRDNSTYLAVFGSGLFNTYSWLAFRNPLNYFGYKYLSIQPMTTIRFIKCSGSEDDIHGFMTRPIGDNDYAGTFHVEYLIDNKVRYEYYKIIPYTFRGVHKCIRLRMGHKMGLPYNMAIGKYCQHVTVISIYHSFSGLK